MTWEVGNEPHIQYKDDVEVFLLRAYGYRHSQRDEPLQNGETRTVSSDL